ncbi:S8 family peptidase [Aliiglaciecola sp. 3_MG-2023]|uniref:S8 family peptidase n=1 Tax=Aliiglaciecola sp. 3_MG-2023 TaxID=3062644 RepID=UPI0026E1CA0E|nr:S8 family peptidase [Aliiglaciecola sp. 3_MG-2023]MDO6694052.1 S8 family peptidase [Aliiglaciecola sp. 3_MG-2023]
MSFFTDKKTLLVGALSFISSVSAVMLTTQANSSSVPFFTESGSTPQMVVSQNVAKEQAYILQGLGRDALVSAVERVGGAVSREFPIINAISAYLSVKQADELASISGIQVTADRNVMTMGNGNSANAAGQLKKFAIDNNIATQTQADLLHEKGITGKGVTVAVLDSGTLMGGEQGKYLLQNQYERSRAFYKYDAIKSKKTRALNDDQNGHGSHVTGIIASSLKTDEGKFNGIAPDVYLLSVKAFDASGNGSYTDVLDGLNYIYQNRNRYRIRVLNLSMGASVQSNYWNDPINQAVMRLWDAGIVVVTSVGNTGSDYATVTVPGNNPYIITVGALTDSYTPEDYSDDRMTTFSSKGPSVEGFVKPEIVAFGGHIASKMNKSLLKNKNFVESETGEDYHLVSGTSQAAAVVTGTIALMLQYNSRLSPDDVKCRLIDSATAVIDPSTGENYGPFTQGAGLINAYEAVTSDAFGCANVGLDLEADLNGVAHFKGPARVTEQGQLLLALNNGEFVAEGSIWDGSSTIEGSIWDSTSRIEGSIWDGLSSIEGSLWDGKTALQGSIWDGSTSIQGSIWDGTTAIEGSIWDGSTILEGSIWDGFSVLEGSIWDGTTSLEGSIWDGLSSLEGSIWDGTTAIEGSLWDGLSSIEGSIWDALTSIEGSIWDGNMSIESVDQALLDESVVNDDEETNKLLEVELD